MEQAHVSLAASSIVRICCDRFEEQDWSGRFYTMYREEPASFLKENSSGRIRFPKARCFWNSIKKCRRLWKPWKSFRFAKP